MDDFKKWLYPFNVVQLLAVYVVVCICAALTCFILEKIEFFNLNEELMLAISGLCAVCATCFTVICSYKAKSKELALNFITGRRVDWINEARKLTGDLCECVWEYVSTDDESNKDEVYLEICGNIANLYMRYNLNDKNDKILLQILDNIYRGVEELKNLRDDENGSKKRKDEREKLMKCVMYLTMHSQIYYKLEWEKVKKETDYGSDIDERDKNIKREIDEERIELYQNRIEYNRDFSRNIEGLSIEGVYKTLISENELVRMSKKELIQKINDMEIEIARLQTYINDFVGKSLERK